MFAAKDRPPQNAAVSSRPVTFAAAARIGGNLRQESQTRPCVFSRLRTLFSAQVLQAPYFHLLPHSLPQERKVTPAFPARSRLFLRSSAQERKLTPLLSGACARFREKCMGGAKFGRNLDCQESLLIFAEQSWPRAAILGICTSRRRKVRYSEGLHPEPESPCAIPVNPL